MHTTINKTKKGMFLSLIALLIVVLFAFVFSLQNVTLSPYRMDIVKARVSTVNDYVKSLFDVYIPNALETATSSALDYVADHSTASSSNPSHVSYSVDFKFLIKQGKSSTDSLIAPPRIELSKTNLEYWFDQINETSSDFLGVKTAIILNDINLTQQDPWNINITANITVMVNAGLAKWNTTRLVETTLSIDGLKDRLISEHISTDEKIITLVDPKQSKEFDWQVSDDASLTQLTAIKQKEVFLHYSKAPSYLQRMKGEYNQQSECCGIARFAGSVDVFSDTASSLDYCNYNGYASEKTGCGPTILFCSDFVLSSSQANYFNVQGRCSVTRPTRPANP